METVYPCVKKFDIATGFLLNGVSAYQNVSTAKKGINYQNNHETKHLF